MRRILVAVVVAVVLAGLAPALAQTSPPAKADVLATIQRFVDGFNKGDTKAATADCAAETSILDEFPPYEWHGAGACGTWMSAYDADAQKNGITDGNVTLAKPTHLDVVADRAYVVVPANYTFKRKGTPEKETGSILTIALHKGPAGWLITGWSWAKH